MRTRYLVPRLRIALIRETPLAEAPPVVRRSADIVTLFGPLLRECDREEFWVVPLDGKHRPIGVHRCSVGTLTASLVHPRELLKPLILTSAAAFVVVHPHPSGDPTPSAEDIALTQRLVQVADLVGIPLLDHVILGADGRYVSFADENMLSRA